MRTSVQPLHRTPREVFSFSRSDRLRFEATIRFFERTGLWSHGRRAQGDLERMTFLDKAYWLYKTTAPIRHARRGSGLEAYFARQSDFEWSLPVGFTPTKTLTLSSVGDLWTHPFLANSRDCLYASVDELLFGADVAMANLECVVMNGAAEKLQVAANAGPSLRFDESLFDIVRGRFSFMATACNHSLDFGADGVDSTITNLTRSGIAYHGINATEEDAQRATILERNGVRLGLLSMTFGLNARKPPAERPLIVNVASLNDRLSTIELRAIEQQLRHCREQEVDFVVAHLHWGLEHEFYPTPEQLGVAHQLAELGVDAVLGHHPHVLQPVEFYRTRRDHDRVVPIYYSLGNLLNPFTAPYLCRGGVARMTVVKGKCRDGLQRAYVQHATTSEVDLVSDFTKQTVAVMPA